GEGTVSMSPAPEYKREFRRGVERSLPLDLPVPKCSACGELFLRPEDSDRIDAALTNLLRTEQNERIRA
ncbi:hypothetical protein LRR18_16945, partial [Mangrovimonas sp. AS39]|uniref:hypothetical protein n=1 Tax=Mangrovimonas futianensis TaxID=2895523 RepID=UPI001E2D7BD2